MNEYELYHHGILGMHWGIRRYQPYPKGHKGGKEVGAAAKSRKEVKGERINRRATRKFNRIERKVQRKQKKANKQYMKAIKKSTRFLSTQRGVDRKMRKGTKKQKKVTRLEYKGQKYYRRVSKKLSRLKIDEAPDVKRLGQKYLDAVANTSKSLYLTTVTGGNVTYKR